MSNQIFGIIFKVAKKVEKVLLQISYYYQLNWKQMSTTSFSYLSFIPIHFQFIFNLFRLHTVIKGYWSLVVCFGGPEKGRLGCLEGKFQEER